MVILTLVDERSCICIESELDLYNSSLTQTSIKHGSAVDYYPVAANLDAGPIKFSVPGSREDYLDLISTLFYVRRKIKNADGTELVLANTAPENLSLHALFNQADIH